MPIAHLQHMNLDEALRLAATRRAEIEASPFAPNLWRYVETAAATYGDAPLWTFFDEDPPAASYGEAATAITRAAAALYAAGVRHGSHVSVMLPNIPEFPICWLALAQLGAVMVPVNVRYTDRELDYVFSDSDSQYLIIHHSYLSTLAAANATKQLVDPKHVIVVGGAMENAGLDFTALLREAPDLPKNLPEAQFDDLASIQYTSGTTGFPKGCMLTHCYWLTIAKIATSRGNIVSDTKNLLIEAPFFYMDPQWVTLMAMAMGGQVFVSRRGSLTKFMKWLRDYEIHYTLWPGRLPAEKEPDFDPSNHLRYVSTYGEFIGNPGRHAELESKFQVIAREAFGMTEIGGGTYMPLEAFEKAGSGSCGIPSPFREAKIIDDKGNELGDEEIGELCIRGPGIMLGYYKKPEANAQSFIEGWFRTGDLFYRDKEGFYYIVGRIKDMIRRNGENISAREVESVVDELPGVLESAAIAIEDAQRGEEVLIAVVLKEGMTSNDLSPEAVIRHCEGDLASFKVPRYVLYLKDALPRTASEKIAKHVLIKERPNLTNGSFDRIANRWI